MIFERSLQRELAYTAGAVFMVLLTIMLTTMMIRIVGFAASGQIYPRDVLVLIGLTVIGYMAVMLIVTLFVSILFVLTRWYKDSEMVVWHASGVSLMRLIKPIGVFSTPIMLMGNDVRAEFDYGADAPLRSEPCQAAGRVLACRLKAKLTDAPLRRVILDDAIVSEAAEPATAWASASDLVTLRR